MNTFIQIGANDGNDEFYKLVCALTEPHQIVLVEPNPEVIPALAKQYEEQGKKHRVIIRECAVSNANGTADFYLFRASAHGSLLNRRTLRDDVHSIQVRTVTLPQLCHELGVNRIECLFIDAEGMDYEILESINFQELPVETIYFEDWVHDVDDLNGLHRTGPVFFLSTICPKLQGYHWEPCIWDNTLNWKLTLK